MAYAPGGTFNAVERERASDAGKVGGRSRSKAKVAAAKENGKSGGRKPTRTLAERLVGRKVRTVEEKAAFKAALGQLLEREKQVLAEFFGVHSFDARLPVYVPLENTRTPWGTTLFRRRLKGRLLKEHLNPTVSVLYSKRWRQKTRRLPKDVRYLIRKLQLAANYLMPG